MAPVSLTEPVEKESSDLKRRVYSFLWRQGVSSAPRLSIDADHGTVTLRGTVRTFYEWQLCSTCAERVAGVLRLVNDLKVELPKRESEARSAVGVE